MTTTFFYLVVVLSHFYVPCGTMSSPTPRRKSQPQPIRTGTYSTQTQVQGPGSNATLDFLKAIGNDQRGLPQLWESIPMQDGRTYGQFKQALHSPQGLQLLDAFQRERKMPTRPTAEAMGETLFNEARQKFMEQAAAGENVGKVLFPQQAMQAYSQLTGRNFVNETLAGPASANMGPSAAEMQRRFTQTVDPGAMLSAGAGSNPGRVAVVPVAAPQPIPRRSIAKR